MSNWANLLLTALFYSAAIYLEWRFLRRPFRMLLTVQISALKEKLQTVQEVEEDIKIQRHDLRHRLQTVTELVARGDTESALKFLDAAQKHLDEQKSLLVPPSGAGRRVFRLF
ncbi:hypothetical protein DW741_06085 [Ruminococcaceae bacterium AM28-23LB]|nr:hypothetical protein DW741_06085 [Ruminococcaceae bacterium AM28-23LB]